MVYNHLCWDRTYRGYTIPAQGFRLVGAAPGWTSFARAYTDGDGFVLENSNLTCRVNNLGELVSLRIAGEDKEFLSGPGNRLLMFKGKSMPSIFSV